MSDLHGTDLQSRRVVVMGLGKFGGGVGGAKFLVEHGADVLVTDLQPAHALRGSLEKLDGLPIEYRLGEHNVSDFTTADLVVANPAVDPQGNRYLRAAEAAGVAITSEIQLLISNLPDPHRVIAITGTAGKSTVTSMIGHILRTVGHGSTAHVGGNIGGSLLGQLPHIVADDWVVLELSSFMLEAMRPDRWAPAVAVVTNISPNHLDRHYSLEAYTAAKQVLLDHQGPNDHAVLGPGLRGVVHPTAGHVHHVEQGPALSWSLTLPGEHNQVNAAIAARAVGCVGLAQPDAVSALATFVGLDHRLKLVAESHGVRWYDDSKSTTPQAAMLAIQSIASQTRGGVHVILGGYDKKTDLTSLAHLAARQCRVIYTIGATGDAIAHAAQTQSRSRGGADVVRCGTLDNALRHARTRLQDGDAFLLSPGCASWDQFENYQQRGQVFSQAAIATPAS